MAEPLADDTFGIEFSRFDSWNRDIVTRLKLVQENDVFGPLLSFGFVKSPYIPPETSGSAKRFSLFGPDRSAVTKASPKTARSTDRRRSRVSNVQSNYE